MTSNQLNRAQRRKLKKEKLNDYSNEFPFSKTELSNLKPELEPNIIMTDMPDQTTNTTDTQELPLKKTRQKKEDRKPDQNPITSGQENSGEPKPKRVAPADKKLIQDLAGMYATVGMITSSFDAYTGVLVIKQCEQRATELVNVARHHPQMMKALKAMTRSNDYVACIAGHGIMLYAILAHFKQVPQHPILKSMGLDEDAVLSQMDVSMNGNAAEFAPAYN